MKPLSVAAIILVSFLGVADAQSNPGQIWFELPDQICTVGVPYVVKVHLNAGTQYPNSIQFNITFDNSQLEVAFSGPLPDLINADLALGQDLVDANIQDLMMNHRSTAPGVIEVSKSGAKVDGPWSITGDIELMQITFHPKAETSETVINGNIDPVIGLLDGDLEPIGTPEVVEPAFPIVIRRLPGPNVAHLLLVAAAILIMGSAVIRRSAVSR